MAVLIIDDEPLLSLYLSELVDEFDFDVIGTAASPEQAKQLARSRAPDIALVDVALREKDDGIPVAHELSELYGTSIILLSGYGDIANRPDVLQLRPVSVLQKPCFPDVLQHALNEAAKALRKKGA